MANEELNKLRDKELEVQSPEVIETEEPNSAEGIKKTKNILVLASLALIVVGSFWVSFQLGRKILFPSGGEPEQKIVVPIPEPPAAIKALQKTLPKEEKSGQNNGSVEEKQVPEEQPVAQNYHSGFYKVQAGLYVDKDEALALESQLNEKEIETYLKKTSTGWRVQVGAFKTKSEAEAMKAALQSEGFKSQILFE